jgi:hyperosmotically inducible protein
MVTRTRFAIVLTCLALAACERPDSPATQAINTGASAPVANNPRVNVAEAKAPVARSVVPPPEATTDAAITGRIGGELAADPAMAGADVSVNTDKGVVTLSGVVKSHEQTGIASAHAQRQDGVLRVDNHLRPQLS